MYPVFHAFPLDNHVHRDSLEGAATPKYTSAGVVKGIVTMLCGCVVLTTS